MPAGIRIAFVALGLLMATAPMARAAGGNPCPAPVQPPALKVNPFNAQLLYSFDYDEQGMRGFDMQAGGRAVPANIHLHGLTTAAYGTSFSFGYRWQQVGAGWCLTPTAVTVNVGFRDMRIYVDKKYPSGSCQRRAVLIHEAKHVAINYEEMNSGIPAMEADLWNAYGAGHFPVYVQDRAAGEKYINDYFTYYVSHAFDRIDKSIAARNSALDNPQEYANIAALCPNW